MPDPTIPPEQDPGGGLAGSLATFFELSAALPLSAAENRALLDVSAETVAALRAASTDLAALDQVKLLRRLDYAIPILRRMLASMTA